MLLDRAKWRRQSRDPGKSWLARLASTDAGKEFLLRRFSDDHRRDASASTILPAPLHPPASRSLPALRLRAVFSVTERS